jgi:hypothetical protein
LSADFAEGAGEDGGVAGEMSGVYVNTTSAGSAFVMVIGLTPIVENWN